ncbi:hypothetical protein [Natronorarus salvus]|uniref:hypothetical protein n=1 Tax=Natronorarus salvus TaxID=3117733 RepID=UPI002F265B6C
MNRRRFLASLAGVGGATLGGGAAALTIGAGRVAASARRRAPSEVRMGTLPSGASVVARTGDRVTVDVRPDGSLPAGRLVGSRRETGSGDLLERVDGPVVDSRGRVTLRFDRPRTNGRWRYVIELERGTDAAYLCESDPLVRSGDVGVTDAPVEDAPTSGRFDHGLRWVGEGRYELTHVWRDDEGRRRRLDYTVGKSAYERSRRRPRGYIRSFADASANRYAGRLGELIATETRRMDEPIEPGERAELDESEAFALAVRYVQSIQYALDSEVKGTHDYHRTVEETLVDCLADCKDATYLLSGILSQGPFGYRTALVFLANHVFLGVRAEDLPDGYGDAGRLPVLDGAYVPIETTARWPVGSYPERPIVALFDGEDWAYVNRDAIGPTLETQIEQFRTHYG